MRGGLGGEQDMRKHFEKADTTREGGRGEDGFVVSVRAQALLKETITEYAVVEMQTEVILNVNLTNIDDEGD